MLDKDSLKPVIESLIFASDTAVTFERLVAVLEGEEKDTIRTALMELVEDYRTRSGGFLIEEVAGGYQFRTNPEFSPWLRRLFKIGLQKISKAAMESLAIIAYKQPLTRGELEAIRGVDSGGVLATLMEKRFIKIVGRKEVPGRPVVYGTTKEFLETFDLKDLSCLPSLKDIQRMEEENAAQTTAAEGAAPDAVEDAVQDRPEGEPEIEDSVQGRVPAQTQAEDPVQERETEDGQGREGDEASRPRPRPTLRKEDRPKARPVNERPKPQEKKISKTPSRAPLKKSLAKTPVVSHLERLQKIIASAGITSRRKAEELITQGRVTVNRETITELGAKADPTKDVIEVDGRNISTKGPRVYVLLNKPKGYISALSDPERRPVVTDLVKISARVYPVGRLDYDAEGVLLLTNDGELSNKLIHPNFKVPKKYLVKVRNVPTPATLERLEKGVHLEDGKTMPAKVRLIRKTAENSWIELTVIEGRNRLVKRMCMAVGHPVNKLKRVEFAGLKLGKLKPGEWRPLTEKEVEELKGL